MNGWIYESPRIHSVSVEKRTSGSINHPNQGWVRFTRNREIAQRDGNKLIIVHCRRLDECLLFGAVAVALDEAGPMRFSPFLEMRNGRGAYVGLGNCCGSNKSEQQCLHHIRAIREKFWTSSVLISPIVEFPNWPNDRSRPFAPTRVNVNSFSRAAAERCLMMPIMYISSQVKV